MKAYKDNSIDICSLYYKEVGHFPPLTADKEKEIRHSVVNGTMTAQKGRELLINGNLRLVVTVAKRYSDKGMPLEDLIQAGNMGLIEAANAFDITKKKMGLLAKVIFQNHGRWQLLFKPDSNFTKARGRIFRRCH